MTRGEPLSLDSVNPDVREAQYAVRGEIVLRAQALQEQLKTQPGSLPFDRIVYCNIGNPQQLGQPPITFFRQVLALVDYPQLLEEPAAASLFPPDVIARARFFNENIPGGTGAYSDSKGAAVCRESVTRFIERRDGFPSDKEDIFLTDGASPAVHYCMKCFIRGKSDAILTPIPQYPLYSATISLYGGTLLPYYLDEASGWALDSSHLIDIVRGARAEGRDIRALVVINPGNPTGQCLSRQNQEEVVRMCHEEQIILIADEVYQDNIYVDNKNFQSFKKVAAELGLLGAFPLISLNSISKGAVGECGRRGGYMELTGVPEEVRDQFLKLASINLCPNVGGQMCTALVMDPPQAGDPSYERYRQERQDILDSLKRRAAKLTSGLNQLEGVSCNIAEGAMYCFPRLTMPDKAIAAADKMGKPVDFFYCLRLLESTGVTVVPGSGFGQQQGTWHFRTTFLPPESDINGVVEAITRFHKQFMDEFR